MIDEAFPILSTPDLVRALGFYELLGAEVTYRFPEDGAAEFVNLRLGGGSIGLARSPEASLASDRFALWCYTDSCDETVARLRAEGVTVVAEPADQPWGERVARVRDHDGNTVYLGERADQPAKPRT